MTKQNWSETVYLPKTSFPMKANLPQREPFIIDFWKNQKIYLNILKSRTNNTRFTLHDGPPYANGRFHVGHALNKILKDIINKYNLLLGKYVNYVPGWDCHGLPIELAVIKKLNKKKGSMNSKKDPNTIRTACREYALEFIKLQAQDQTRMGVFWDDTDIQNLKSDGSSELSNIYYTMSRYFESTILETFQSLFKKGLIYKGKKPIHWCASCATALAEAEVEYQEHTSPSIYVKFPVTNIENFSNNSNQKGTQAQAYVVIWTTTPWTLPANLAVAFHPQFEYSIYQTSMGNLIIASGLEEKFFEETGLTFQSKKVVSQKDIQSWKVKHPFLPRESVVVLGEHVTLEAGTGIVHTAPGHGHDDYIIGQKYNLDIFTPVDHRGRYTKEFQEMEGVKVFEANHLIIQKLKDTELLVHSKEFQHNYPHCWRCHKPLIFRAAPQWFLSIEPLKEKGLRATKKTKWIPHWGENRFESTIINRPDWCLSRQRFWGVPIPSFRCISCGESYLNEKTLDHIVKKVQKEGIEVWFQEDINTLLPKNTKCSCGSTEFEKENDILDVWFDSGVTWNVVLKKHLDLGFPSDLYLEGSDQHRGWFQSSLWPALALEGQAPYKKVLTHGYVLDEKGRAMSKSLGNVISPTEDIIPKYGADVLRLWVSSEDYRTDNTIGFSILNQLSESYRKIRNTFRYLLGNLQDGNFIYETNPSFITHELDIWILHRFSTLGKTIKKAYENYEFHHVYQEALHFCTIDLSQIYFDIIRDSLYCDAHPNFENKRLNTTNPTSSTRNNRNTREKRRNSALQTLSVILKNLNIWLSPVLSFTMEEIYQILNQSGQQEEKEKKQSVFNEIWPELSEWENPDIEKKFAPIWALKEKVNIKLEEARNQKKIGSSIDAIVSLSKKDGISDIFSFFESRSEPKELLPEELLAEYFVVSKVILIQEPLDSHTENTDDLSFIKVESFASLACNSLEKSLKNSFEKCPRCWLYRELTPKGVCSRCDEVVG